MALEVMPERPGRRHAGRLLEETTRTGLTRTCLDVGHAHLTGDVAEAAETVAGYVTTTHIHDNRGTDEHLVPFDGTIDWAAAMIADQDWLRGPPGVRGAAITAATRAAAALAAGARRRVQAVLDRAAGRPFTF